MNEKKNNVTPVHIKDSTQQTEIKIKGLFPCYVLLGKTWNVVSVLNLTIMLNNLSVLSSMASVCEIAPALHSCYLFLMQSVKTWKKILKKE